MRTWRLALEGLFSLAQHKGKALLMALGATVGIAVIMVIMGLNAGEQKVMAERLRKVGARAILVVHGHGRMSKAVGGQEKKLEPADADAVRQNLPQVEMVSAYALKGSMPIKAGPAQTKSMVLAVDTAWNRVEEWPVVEGETITILDEERMSRLCLLGATVKRELFGQARAVGQFVRLGDSRFKVKGVLEARGVTGQAHDRDRRVVIPMSTGISRLFRQRHINGMRAKVRPGHDLEKTAADILHLLNRRHQVNPDLEQPFSAITSTQMMGSVKGLSDTVWRLLVALGVLALVVGGGVQTNIMLTSVSMRRAEIGLRLALGASAPDIRTQFLAEAMGVGFMGLIAGLVLGWATLWGLDGLSQLPVAFSGWGVLLAVGCALATGIGFGVYPAQRAARMDPVEALSCT